MRAASKASLLVVLCSLAVACAHEIEHVVVAMLANRAFDHMLGFMSRGGPQGDVRVDGLTGKECNPTGGKGGEEVCVNDLAQDHCPYDPDHKFSATTERIFNCEWNKTAGTPCTDIQSTKGNPTMQG